MGSCGRRSKGGFPGAGEVLRGESFFQLGFQWCCFVDGWCDGSMMSCVLLVLSMSFSWLCFLVIHV